jgi:phosphate:Na+ symporter
VLGLDAPAASLALFHTLFNVLGVLIMWPFTRRLADFLEGRFITPAEMLARPTYLDRTVLVTPALALEALKRELARAVDLAASLAGAAVSGEAGADGAQRDQRHGLAGLLDAVESFVANLERSRLPEPLAAQLPVILRASNYLEDVAGLSEDLERHQADLTQVNRPPVDAAISAFLADLAEQIGACAETSDPAVLAPGLAALEPRAAGGGQPRRGAHQPSERRPGSAAHPAEDGRAAHQSPGAAGGGRQPGR